MRLLNLIKKRWEIAQFIAIGFISFLISTWNAVIANATGYIMLNESTMDIMIGICVTSGVLTLLVVLIKESW